MKLFFFWQHRVSISIGLIMLILRSYILYVLAFYRVCRDNCWCTAVGCLLHTTCVWLWCGNHHFSGNITRENKTYNCVQKCKDPWSNILKMNRSSTAVSLVPVALVPCHRFLPDSVWAKGPSLTVPGGSLDRRERYLAAPGAFAC